MKRILFENEYEKPSGLNKKKVIQNIDRILSYMQISENYEISITICNNQEIELLNKKTRGIFKPTDVLSYPLNNDHPGILRLLGEVFISYEKVKEQANKIGHSEIEEFYRLLVHGILHLLGYDHELDKASEILMREKEEKCLELIFN